MLRATWDRWSQLSLLFLMSVGGDLQKVSEEGQSQVQSKGFFEGVNNTVAYQTNRKIAFACL